MIIRPEAEADVVNARNWYEQQREGLGAAFLLCVEEALERISRTPEMYTTVYH
jgi:toxin ParE1/3/4